MFLSYISLIVMIIAAIFVALGFVNMISTKKNREEKSNKMMFYRVAAQAIAIILLVIVSTAK